MKIYFKSLFSFLQISSFFYFYDKIYICQAMTDFFNELFEYSHHYNQKLINVIAEQPDKVSDKTIKLLNHVLNAHHIWNCRIALKPNTYRVWDIHSNQDLKQIDDDNYKDTMAILNNPYDLEGFVDYATTQKQKFNNKVKDILFHIINHATYHRGQIASDLRQSGIEPIVTDFIFYKRQ